MPAISIIVPIYNAEKFIERCVQSVLQQSFTLYELLLIDDGSIDNSYQRCQQLAKYDHRIKVYHKENGGASSARKFGVHHSVGKYVMFVDADDTIPKNALEDLYTKAIENEFDITQGERVFIVSQTQEEVFSNFKEEEICTSSKFLHYLFSGYTSCGPVATLYKRSLFDSDTFDLPKDVRINEDFYMNLCLGLNSKKIGLITKLVYHYHENENSITHNYIFKSLNPQKSLFRQIKKILIKHKVYEDFLPLFYSRLINSICSACFHNKDLIYDPDCAKIAKSALSHLHYFRDKALCILLLHPILYSLFSFVNKIRQTKLGHKRH